MLDGALAAWGGQVGEAGSPPVASLQTESLLLLPLLSHVTFMDVKEGKITILCRPLTFSGVFDGFVQIVTVFSTNKQLCSLFMFSDL